MITKGIEHQGCENITVAEFGDGDIGMEVLPSTNNETFGVLFSNTEKGEIGVSVKRKIREPEMWFIFKNIESLDIVIHALQECKRLMELK